MPFIGNTVRLVVKFKDFDGVLTDTESLSLTFYDHRRNQIGGSIDVDIVENKDSTGIYFYDYTIPITASKSIVAEFVGIVDGTDSVGRVEIPLRWS